MTTHPSSPADSSPLSSRASSEFGGYDEEMHDLAADDVDMPPSKKPRLNGKGGSATPSTAAAEHAPSPMIDDEVDNNDALDDVDISSDSSGDIPVTPTVNHLGSRLDDDDGGHQEQVTVCAWVDCDAGDLGNMDRLVDHIHNAHIEGRQKKYTCEWVGCGRQSMPHASGYALKAHMRSHTREKPFYCYLPECDRSFTRSDALAKHMRTVHETEALRPSDPVPKSMQAGSGQSSLKPGSKLKIVIKTPQSQTGEDDAMGGDESSDEVIRQNFTPLSRDDGFEVEELVLPLQKLHMLCRKQLQWAEADGEELGEECKEWERIYKEAWLEKETVLDQVMQSESDWQERRKAVLASAAGEPAASKPTKPNADDSPEAGREDGIEAVSTET